METCIFNQEKLNKNGQTAGNQALSVPLLRNVTVDCLVGGYDVTLVKNGTRSTVNQLSLFSYSSQYSTHAN